MRWFWLWYKHPQLVKLAKATAYGASAVTTILWLYLGALEVKGNSSSKAELADILREMDIAEREARAQEFLDKENIKRIKLTEEQRQYFLKKYPNWTNDELRFAAYQEHETAVQINTTRARKETSALYGLDNSSEEL